MASVSSLDQDMRKLRLSRYTPAAANEARAWIEESLGENLPSGDLLETLKDGSALCRLANLAIGSQAIRFKKSAMPFVQMENISHFLRACENPPLNMPSHDRFLTVDLYEAKDPAQVLQCLSAFSRIAAALNPSKFSTTIGPKRSGGISPQRTGGASNSGRDRGGSTASQPPPRSWSPVKSSAVPPLSPTRTGGSSSGIQRSPTGLSSWSNKSDQSSTAPAWNPNVYGYMGGASQGNQGIAFGARRQITTAGPHVPSLADKQRKRREQEMEAEQLRQQEEEVERQRRLAEEEEQDRQRRAKEDRARAEEERKWADQKREWEEQERRWKEDEEARNKLNSPMQDSDSRPQLRGQYLSEYKVESQKSQRTQGHARSRRNSDLDGEPTAEQLRVKELERQLEEAKERERQYQLEREDRHSRGVHTPLAQQDTGNKARSRSRSRPAQPKESSPHGSDISWAPDEREQLRQEWSKNQRRDLRSPADTTSTSSPASRPLPPPTSTPRTAPTAAAPPSLPTRPLPDPSSAAPSPRPLPDPTKYSFSPVQKPSASAPNNTTISTPPITSSASRTTRFLASHPAPPPFKPATHIPDPTTSTAERDSEDARRVASQERTKAGAWASKSLLEREMERERERQREWEEGQQAMAGAPRDRTEGTGEGQSWDVNQYGWAGGDSQNRGAQGIGFGGRRQIIGPRPLERK